LIKKGIKKMKWINVKDKLPQDGQMCLVTAKIYFIPEHFDDVNNYIDIEIKQYSAKCGWGNDDSFTRTV
jgi:hypothetical protein